MRRERLKYLVLVNRRALPESTDPSLAFRYLDIGAVGRGELIEDPIVTTFGEAPSRARRLVRDGDTIISTVRTYLRAVWPVRGKTDDLVVSTGFAVLSPTAELDSRYLGWLAQSDVVVEEVVARSVGVSYPGINASEIGDVPVSIPSIETQRAIADYLDAETARIDALVEKRRRMIELVEERRLRVIADAVGMTRERQDTSGRPRLKHACRIERGRFIHRPRNDPMLYGGEAPFVQTGDIRSASKFIRSYSQTLNELGRATSRSFPSGTPVMSIAANVGDVAITTFETWCPDSVVGFKPGPYTDAEYLYYVLVGLRGRINETSTENTQENTNIEILGELPLLLPAIEEQKAVAAQVARQDEATASLITSLRAQIDLLSEHRQALIACAVTGELDIRGAAA